MDKQIRTAEYYLNSPTSKKIGNVFIEGSSPTLKQIQQLYLKWSKTECKESSFNKKTGRRSHKSLEATKKRRANKLYNKLVGMSYWNFRE